MVLIKLYELYILLNLKINIFTMGLVVGQTHQFDLFILVINFFIVNFFMYCVPCNSEIFNCILD